MSESIGFEVVLNKSFDQAFAQLGEALKVEGFGILSQIDVQKTLKDKIGVDFRRYYILGVCNPSLAHQALTLNAEAGLMLPCGATIETEDDTRTTIRIGDPLVRLQAAGFGPEMDQVGQQAREKLLRVANSLK